MRTIKIGDKEFKQAEKAEDISIKRFLELKKFIFQKHTRVPLDSLTEFMKGFLKAFDDGSKSDMLITCYNYFNGLKELQEDFDASQYIFALITFEEGEDPVTTDNTLLKEKLERFSKLGLTQGDARDAAENFIKDSPILLDYFSLRNLASQQPMEI